MTVVLKNPVGLVTGWRQRTTEQGMPAVVLELAYDSNVTWHCPSRDTAQLWLGTDVAAELVCGGLADELAGVPLTAVFGSLAYCTWVPPEHFELPTGAT